MQVSGLLYGAPLLKHVGFPVTEVLGPGASEDEIQGLLDRHGQIFIKPVFRGGKSLPPAAIARGTKSCTT